MRKHLAFQDRMPPHEFKLWSRGDNPTDYGLHIWNDRSVAEVYGHYAKRGNPLLIDLEHDVGKGPEIPDPLAPTGGYARLDIRNGEPWLTFEWSSLAEEQIRTGQRRYLSPEYFTDETTGEIVGLVRVSLVASPGTHHARVLASAPKDSHMDPMMLAALRAALTAEDPKTAIEALLEEMGKAGGEAESPAEGDAASAADAGGDKPAPYAPGSGSGEPKKDDAVAAESKETKEEPVAAAEEKPEEKPVAASAAPTMPKLPAKLVVKQAASAAPAGPQVQDAITRVDDLERDMLLRAEGDRLVPSIRTWASAQPLSVVKSLIDAAPSRTNPPAQARPVRGGQLGANGVPVKRQLTGEARREFETIFVPKPLPAIGPTRTPEGNLRIHAGCPGEYRAQLKKAGA